MQARLLKISGIAVAIIVTAVILSLVISRDSDLSEGEPVIITLGETEILGHVYTIRGDRRYTIRYMTEDGTLKLGTFKRFEFRKLNPDDPNEAPLIILPPEDTENDGDT